MKGQSMALFAVTITATTASGDPVWFPFWHNDLATLDEFLAAMIRDGVLQGIRFKTKREGPRHRILDHKPYILGKNMVGQVVEMSADALIDFTPPNG
jgi:hypothetical protein